MSDNTAVRAAKLDKIFGTPVFAVLLAILNALWGEHEEGRSAHPATTDVP